MSEKTVYVIFELMKIRAVQFSPALGRINDNLDYHLHAIEQAIGEKFELIVFPELSLTGYLLKDIVYELDLSLQSETINRLKQASRQIDILAGLPLELEAGIFYNCAVYFADGEILHIHKKVDLPNFGIFDEKMIFKSGSSFRAFQRKGWKIGLLICREILFPQNSYLYHLQNCDLLLAISNSPFRSILQNNNSSTFLWETMGFVISHFFQMHYLFVNRCGDEDGLIFPGGSFFAHAGSGLKKLAPYFEQSLLDIRINQQEVRRARIVNNYLRDQQPEIIKKELERIINELSH